MTQKYDKQLEDIAKEYENSDEKVKVDTYIKQSTLTNILTRARKEGRNKSQMIRVILEQAFE